MSGAQNKRKPVNYPTYVRCLCDGTPEILNEQGVCRICEGDNYRTTGVGTEQIRRFANGHQRLKHVERYLDTHPGVQTLFKDWLRKNPYMPEI